VIRWQKDYNFPASFATDATQNAKSCNAGINCLALKTQPPMRHKILECYIMGIYRTLQETSHHNLSFS
jgi:hypothetical protein